MEFKDRVLEETYNELEKKIILSESYINFIIKNVIENKTFEAKIREYFLDDNGVFQGQKFYEFMQDVKYMEMLSHALGIEDEFYAVTMNGAKANNVYDTVVNTKLLETLYGNPKKDDFTYIDIIFKIFECVFSLDVILMSLKDKNVLKQKFRNVLKRSSEFDSSDINFEEYFNEFFNEIEELYKNTSDIKDYEQIKAYIKNNCDGLIPYIMAGLNAHINIIIKDENGSFKDYDPMMEEILDLFKKEKIM